MFFPPATLLAPSLYAWLMEDGCTDPFDRHVYACVLALAASEGRPLTVALGLSPGELDALLLRHFPHAVSFIGPVPVADDGAGSMAPEEPDLIRLLQDGADGDDPEAGWLAAIIARRSLGANHLWQDLGLGNRKELSRLLQTHFPALAARNTGDMKWKKFFYRELCQQEGILICKSPNCEVCNDFTFCFGAETGDPLAMLAARPEFREQEHRAA